MEQVVRCPLCGGGSATKLFDAKDRLHRLPGEFGIVQCRGCQLIRLSPRPLLERIGDYYPDEEYYSYQRASVSVRTVLTRGPLQELRDDVRNLALVELGYPVMRPTGWHGRLRPLVRGSIRNKALYGMAVRFPAYQSGGRVLDVGCGNGAFLSYLKHHGWKVAGVEIGRGAADAAKRDFDIDVFVGPLHEAPFPDESFDLIYINHAIEHMYDPLATLRSAVALLKNGGRLYIETPNFDSIHQRHCGTYWLQLDAPRHLYLFSPLTLGRLVEAAGLRVERFSTYTFRQIYHWEDTYRREELEGERLDPRPRLRMSARPRAILLRLLAAVERLWNPLGEDSLCCWTIKP